MDDPNHLNKFDLQHQFDIVNRALFKLALNLGTITKWDGRYWIVADGEFIRPLTELELKEYWEG